MAAPISDDLGIVGRPLERTPANDNISESLNIKDDKWSTSLNRDDDVRRALRVSSVGSVRSLWGITATATSLK